MVLDFRTELLYCFLFSLREFTDTLCRLAHNTSNGDDDDGGSSSTRHSCPFVSHYWSSFSFS